MSHSFRSIAISFAVLTLVALVCVSTLLFSRVIAQDVAQDRNQQYDPSLIQQLQLLPVLKQITLHKGTDDGTFKITFEEAVSMLQKNLPNVEIIEIPSTR